MLLTDFSPLVALELPGCTDYIVQRVAREEIYNLYRDFVLWLYEGPQSIGADGAVSLTTPAQTTVHDIRSLRVGTIEIAPVGAGSTNSDEYDEVGAPKVVLPYNDSWLVRPAPGTALTATSVLHIGPTYTFTEIPDTIAGKHRAIWEHLVLTRLQMMSGQEWSNPKAASYHATEATRLVFEERRRMDGWSARRAPVVRYGGI